MVLTSFLLICLSTLLTECILFHFLVSESFPPLTYRGKKKKKPPEEPPGLSAHSTMAQGCASPAAAPAPFSTWWHHHSSVITVLYLSDIQHRYHDNRKRTVQSHTYLNIPLHPRPTPPKLPSHRWLQNNLQGHRHMYRDISAQRGCSQQPHLLSVMLFHCAIYNSSLLKICSFWRMPTLIIQQSTSDNNPLASNSLLHFLPSPVVLLWTLSFRQKGSLFSYS